jgi:superfamily II DNA or RNA helicase
MIYSELDIKPSYDSRKTNVFDVFFNQVLSNSNYYRRFGGLFSAKRFALAAEGLQDFIKENDGMMELAIIPIFSDDDKEAIKKGISVDAVVAKNWIKDLSEIKEKFQEDHLKALAWMIANKFLTIKLILPEHGDGTPLTESELLQQGIFRKEIGIFYNKDDNSLLSFHGIIDREDSEVGELYSIDVSRGWISSEKEQIDIDHEDFGNFWDSDNYQWGSINCKIVPLSEELEDFFKKIAPKTKKDIPDLKKLPVLRTYQTNAIDDWYKNNGRGIFEMATGTGKTFTGIGCIKKLEKTETQILIIIAVPYRNLVDQWKEQLSKWFMESIILEQGVWRQDLRDEVTFLNRTSDKKISILITSHDLFATEDFVKQIERCKIPTMLIVDEAHHVGTFSSRRGLSKNYHYRLALSATIDRYFDDDGTDFLKQYFSGDSKNPSIASYSMKKAIDEGKLCKYNYYPFFIELNDDEIIQYKELTIRAAKYLSSKNIEERKKGEKLLMTRSKIIRDAENKTKCFIHILKEIKTLKHLLIFCSENQFDDVDGILSNLLKHCGIDKSLLFRRITYDNPSDTKERTKILNDFSNEDWDALLSNRVLDEGMDIPQARICIVLAATGNPTQFIQRRGRVLRVFDEQYKDGTKKKNAEIYDILVKPQINNLDDPDAIRLEMGMIRSQLSRIQSMSELAINHTDCTKKIEEFTYGLPLDKFYKKLDDS